MREGGLNAAGDILKQIPAQDADWPVLANLGRIYESELSHARALECYELAAAKAPNPIAASRIQLRIARCLGALGRSGEVRRVLEYALDLDPENINARLELDRMESR
jgi:tetratricopeptide (TPR) repeat protein